ncbi:retroviral aspartyl protease [Ostertagia ostertagi]
MTENDGTARGGCSIQAVEAATVDAADRNEQNMEAATMDATDRNEQNTDKATMAGGMPARDEIDRLVDEPPRMLDMEVNGKKVSFELDTGASLSIIDERTWRMLGRPRLEEAKVAATAFDNKRITFQGKVPLHISFAGKEAIVDVHVFKEASHSLCGRDMIRRLQIDCGPHYDRVHSVTQMPKVEIKKQLVRILNSNKRLFQDGLGRVTPHAATGKAPAEMLMGRSLRTTLDIIKAGKRKGTSKYREEMKRNYDRGKKERTFEVGQEVFIRNYTGSGDRWIPGMVMKVLGSSTYEVHYGMGVRKTHADQMKPRVIPWEAIDDNLLRKMDRKLPSRSTGRSSPGRQVGAAPSEQERLRRSRRKRQATEKMRDFLENRKRRKINVIRIAGEDGNKNKRDHSRPYKRGLEECGSSVMFALPTNGALPGGQVQQQAGPPMIVLTGPQGGPGCPDAVCRGVAGGGVVRGTAVGARIGRKAPPTAQ